MQKSLASTAGLIIASLMLATIAPTQAAQPHTNYLPIVAKDSTGQSYADSYSVTLPFTVLDSVQASPVAYGGAFYFVAYRVDSGDKNGGWVLRWSPDSTTAVAVEQISTEDAPDGASRGVTPIGQFSPSRGSLVTMGGALYHWSFPASTGRATRLEIKVVAR
jgi:hypothetical protein